MADFPGPSQELPQLEFASQPVRGECVLLNMKAAEWHAQAGDRVVLVKMGAGGEGYVVNEVAQPTMPWCVAIDGGPAEGADDVMGKPAPWSLAFPVLPDELTDGQYQFIYLDAGGRRSAVSEAFAL
eukprot:TRINITY_DN9889_c0_g1_i1.p1 TRINITY_DN9889_c0_g1~~TRINITY_DN9889_c0_g1_i1.p1  ORF type:complete len:126 (+),score=5.99 TRINITY_DN9889_c0_g1_i1:86-463(+)